VLRESEINIKRNIRNYWHKRSKTYDKFPAADSEEEEKAAYSNVLKRFFNGNSREILDVGTGTGFMAMILAEMGHKTTGIDITEAMLEEARHKACGNSHGASFQIGDAENLPFGDASFDAIVCRYLLWTLPDPRMALNEWHRVIRPGGMIICVEGQWSHNSLKGRLKKMSRKLGILLYEKTNPRQLGYDNETNKRLLFRSGFVPEQAIALFQEGGLVNISTELLTDIRNIQARNMPLLYRLALPPPTFLIKGERR